MQSRRAPQTRRPGSLSIPCTGTLCLGLPCASRWGQGEPWLPGGKPGANVHQQHHMKYWSCPCAGASLCWEIPGRLRQIPWQSRCGDGGLWAGTKHPCCSRFLLRETCWWSPEMIPVKKTTCCRNIMKGRGVAAPSSLTFCGLRAVVKLWLEGDGLCLLLCSLRTAELGAGPWRHHHPTEGGGSALGIIWSEMQIP